MGNTPATISKAALQHLKRLEGSVSYVYDDGDGTWPRRKITSFRTKGYPTIGVGHRILRGEQDYYRRYLGGREMPEQEVLALLQRDVINHSRPLRSKIKTPITQAMWDALVLQSFNTGPNTKAIRTAIDRINAKDWRGAQAALARGAVTSKGDRLDALVRRRAEEAAMFLSQGVPGAAQQMLSKGKQALRAAQRQRKKLSRVRQQQVILGVGASLFAAIAVVALVARKQAQ